MSNDNNNRINTSYDQPETVVRRLRRNGATINEWYVFGDNTVRVVPDAELPAYERENNVGMRYLISPVVPEGYDINGHYNSKGA